MTARRLLRTYLAWLLALLGQAAFAQDVPGVRAEYFNYSGNPPTAIPASGAVVDRVESNINVMRSTSAPAPGIGSDNYLTRYTGTILVPTTGTYTFQVDSDDGVRLYVDCNNDGVMQGLELLIDKWMDQSTATYQASCPSNLVAGTRYRFRVEYYERGGEQSIRLSWSGPSPVGSTQTVIPRGTATQGLYSGVVDNTPPTIVSASLACGATNQILVTFSETLDASSAQTVANYSLTGGHTITSATLTGDGTSVALTLSPNLTANRMLTVNNVQDLAGNRIATNSTATVPFSPTTLAAGLIGDYYGQNSTARAYFSGNSVQRIDGTVDFDWGSGTPGVTGVGADDFSVRWTGLVRVPTTGTYNFRTLSDDGVRLYVNGSLVIDNWSDHGTATDTSTGIPLTAGSYVPITLEYYERGGGAVIRLQWLPPAGGSYAAVPAAQLFHCVPAAVASFTINGTGAASTCKAQTLTITARDSNGALVSNYTGTVNLSTSTGRGNWTPGQTSAPLGNLTPGAANSGKATYQFAVADGASVQLQLSHSLAQSVTVTVVDNSVSGSSTTSAPITFSDNTFVWAEDVGNKIAGTNIVVAGRPHDMQVSLMKKDPTTGICGVADDFAGSRSLRLWRTDNVGPWTAPSVVSPALSVPASRPASNNLTLTFTAGVATFNLGTTDIGKYTLNLDDDSLTYATSTISGGSSDLTVRPFAIVISGLTLAGTANPGGSNATDAVFGKAGASFAATVAAYRWSSSADSNNDGVPDSGATLAQTTAGGLTPSYNTPTTLTAVAASQTPAGGVMGTISNNAVSGFSGGAVTVSNLAYSEVGSFQLNTTGVVSNFLSSGIGLDAVAFNAVGAQQTRIGRFIPAGFVLSNPAVAHRNALACSPASIFTYLGEDFGLAFTLTAQNTAGATTQNYTGAFAKLVASTPATLNLAGISGTTMFKASRLSYSNGSGTWSNGTVGVGLTANVARLATTEGPFDSAQFGVSPVDSDGVGMVSLNLDTDSPNNGVDSASLGTIRLRYGRLRLQNALGAANRAMKLPLTAQYWNGSAFVANDLDACTRVSAANLSFGNYRPSQSSVVVSPSTITVDPINGSFITLTNPGGGRLAVDVAIALGSTSADSSCMQASWSRSPAASSGANLPALRGGWCGSAYNDPSARVTWGVYRGSDGVVYQRENY